MTLFALGINHKTASIALRERLAFSTDALVDALQVLKPLCGLEELAILSTCNRTEFFCRGDQQQVERLVEWLWRNRGLDPVALKEALYCHEGNAAVRHIMRVSCGLDSLVLGEPQVLGQIKQAYSLAKQADTLNSTMERLFQQVFSVAKEVRSETEIGNSAVSVAFAAVNLAKHIFSTLDKSSVLLVGAGETIELVARHLADSGVKRMSVANRTVARAMSLADEFGAEPITLGQIPERLSQADIVISSTAAPLPIIGTGMVKQALDQRRRKPMLLIDLAVPRDIEEQVGELDDAYLYSVDDLQGIVEKNMEARRDAAKQAEQIIDHQVSLFSEWRRSLNAVDSITRYRSESEQIKQQLLTRAQKALQNGQSADNVLNELANKLTNRLIHQPTTALKEAGASGDTERVQLIRSILGLDPESGA